MMIVVTMPNGFKSAVNTEKIITVNGIYPDGSNNHARSMINTTESTAIFIRETPEEIAAMCNQNKY